MTGVVEVELDLTLERDCHLRNITDHGTTLIVIECEPSRDRARHRKDVVGMTSNQTRPGLLDPK